MNSKKAGKTTELYVWIWLPGETAPIVAGRLAPVGQVLSFNYGKSYLARDNAIPIFLPELPLRSGVIPPMPGLTVPGCIRDAAPDAWGRRVILNKRFGKQAATMDPGELSELEYLIESGSDRIGFLDFQRSPSIYEPRSLVGVSLEELLQAAELVEKGVPLSPELAEALQRGTSIGGARPKALVEGNGEKLIAKFSTSSDVYSVVKAEFIAMRLAALAGLQVAPVSLRRIMGKDILMVSRFDRVQTAGGWARRGIMSALTILGLDELMARYASYFDLADIIRQRFAAPGPTLRELFSRLVFNILVGNTDDHARNHAAFWNGGMLELTPAYDICPQSRSGRTASQAMAITKASNASSLANCLQAAPTFLLREHEAVAIVEHLLACIMENWDRVCDEAQLSEVDRNLLWRNQILNPFIFEALEHGPLSHIPGILDV